MFGHILLLDHLSDLIDLFWFQLSFLCCISLLLHLLDFLVCSVEVLEHRMLLFLDRLLESLE